MSRSTVDLGVLCQHHVTAIAHGVRLAQRILSSDTQQVLAQKQQRPGHRPAAGRGPDQVAGAGKVGQLGT